LIGRGLGVEKCCLGSCYYNPCVEGKNFRIDSACFNSPNLEVNITNTGSVDITWFKARIFYLDTPFEEKEILETLRVGETKELSIAVQSRPAYIYFNPDGCELIQIGTGNYPTGIPDCS